MFYILLTIWYGCLLLCVRYWNSLLISYSNYTLETASHFFVGFLVRYFSLLGFFDFHEFFFFFLFFSHRSIGRFGILISKKFFIQKLIIDHSARILIISFAVFRGIYDYFWELEWDVKPFEWFAVGTKLKGVKNFIEDVY